MSSDDASRKKVQGHINERHFAQLIDGEVYKAQHTGKTDVLDKQGNTHSVKSGEWWQIFLYRRSRFVYNTEFNELGNIAPVMIDCLDAFPEDREDYLADKDSAKERLQVPMRNLRQEIEIPGMFPEFLRKSIFNGGEVDYISILPCYIPREVPVLDKQFHIFDQDDVVEVLSNEISLANSMARNSSETDDQKVLLRTFKNVGEIEVRTDSGIHYREMKFRMNSAETYRLLTKHIGNKTQATEQLFTYGEATQTFRI